MNPLSKCGRNDVVSPDMSAAATSASGRHSSFTLNSSLRFAALVAACAAAVVLHGADEDRVVALYSSISPAYHRQTVAGGTFQPETYAFGDGGFQPGARGDATLDRLSFMDVARRIAPSLASQNYLPCDKNDPRHTDLLIMVYWGATVGTDDTSHSMPYQIAQSYLPPPRTILGPPPNGLADCGMTSDPSTSGRAELGEMIAVEEAAASAALQTGMALTNMANRERDRRNYENATLLGYLPELRRTHAYARTPLNQRRQDVLDELEESRYYVILLAYDFQTLRQHKQRKLLWETRFSIRERHNDFAQQLASMAHAAAPFFGRATTGLVRRPAPNPIVTLGDLRVLEDEPEQKQ